MIYIFAIFLSLLVCVQGFLSEIARGNIGHLRNGRPPNAGAALFPPIPLVQLLAVTVTWLLRHFVPQYAAWILLTAFCIFSGCWIISFARLQGRLDQATAAAKETKTQAPN
jgi:hypothetical protein